MDNCLVGLGEFVFIIYVVGDEFFDFEVSTDYALLFDRKEEFSEAS
jgi:hypothetical protein